MTRNGKIARLPADIREELNRRLECNIPGITLVEWLNSLPEVQEVLRDLFDGVAIIPQNLSQWRQGGFLEWQARNDLFNRVRNADATAESLEKINGHIIERAAQLLSARFAVALAEWDTGPHAPPVGEDHDSAQQSPSRPPASIPSIPPAVAALKSLLPLARVIAQLRRGDREHARLKMDKYRFDRFRRNKEESDARSAEWDRACAEAAAAKATTVSPPATPTPTPVPDAADTQSHSITPLSSSNDGPRPEEPPSEEAPLPAASPPSAISPDPTLPLPEAEKLPAETPSTAATIKDPPLSDWEMRNRPLPSDPSPDWRVQLPIKTVLPSWLTPYSYKTHPPARARTSR